MVEYNIPDNGDHFEKKYYPLFLKKYFPNYEQFWRKHVIPLTNRPDDLHFKFKDDLEKIGKNDNDICIAQLHYTVFKHLTYAFEFIKDKTQDEDNFLNAFIRIICAQDVAFEFLERTNNKDEYIPWINGKKIREKWQKNNNHPLNNLRAYRNTLIHSGKLPTVSVQYVGIFMPEIGKEIDYLDWRKVTKTITTEIMEKDFMQLWQILSKAWKETIDYFQIEWDKILVP